MEKMNDLRDLLKHEIEDLYSAEEQIIEALPVMIAKAGNKNLQDSLKEHLKITEQQKARLDKIQAMMKDDNDDNKRKGILKLFSGKHVCKGMKGIIDEGNKIMGEDLAPEVMDAAIIASAQKVEHYEICGYGTARSYAEELQLTEIAMVLEQTLKEEYEADVKLTMLAESKVNKDAEANMGGDRSGAGSSRSRETTSQRVPREELEPVSARTAAASSRKAGTSRGGGKPASQGSTRKSNAGKPDPAGSRTKTGNGRGSARRNG